MTRILYYGAKGSRKPSGGYAALLQHVGWLRQAGIAASLLVEPGFAPEFEAPDAAVPVVEAGPPLEATDILVMPETDLRPVARLRGAARLWICCQNHHQMFHTAEQADAWETLGVEGVLATSASIEAYIGQHFPTLRRPYVPYGIDPVFVTDGSGRRVAGRVVVMPRKRPQQATFIRHSFTRRYPGIAVEWVEVDRVPRAAVAAALKAASVFLFLGRTEGFGLPGVEAMAAGAIVVGFAGEGVKDYAQAKNGFWSAPDDFDAVVDDLAVALELDRAGSPLAARYRAAGAETARRYRESRSRGKLVAFWQEVLRGG